MSRLVPLLLLAVLACGDEDRTQTEYTASLDRTSTSGDDSAAAAPPAAPGAEDTVPAPPPRPVASAFALSPAPADSLAGRGEARNAGSGSAVAVWLEHGAAGQSYAGSVLAWKPDGAGGYSKHAGGLRSPNGGGLGPNGIMMFTDNQGSWNPSCALNVIKPNSFYGSHQNSGFKDNWGGAANKAGTLPYVPPAAWLLQAQAVGQYGVGASSMQPLYMDHGPYAGDVVVGDGTLEGISRVALDPVNGGTGTTANYNGSVQWFTNHLKLLKN